jgi:hypothetical protein
MADGDPEQPSRRQRPHILWWAYIALLVVMFVLGFAAFFADGFFTALGPTLVSAALLSHNVVCIAGLYAYLRGIPLFAPMVWRIMLTVLIAHLFYSASFFVPAMFTHDIGQERLLALGSLLLLGLWGPLIYALWRYAFKSPHVWSHGAADAAG